MGRSDGRERYRRRLRSRSRARPDPEAVRRRAEALLAGGVPPPAGQEAAGEPSGSGGSAGTELATPAVGAGASRPVRPVRPEGPDRPEGPEGPEGPDRSEGSESGRPGGSAPVRAGAWRSALRERLPLWVQARCGVEPRTVAAVAVVLVVAVGFAGRQFWAARPGPVTAPAVVAPAAVAAAPSASAATASDARVVVDVGGKVREPGVRRLPGGSRVEDALAAAGGVRPGTDTTGLNRARVLVDGEQVLVGVTAQPPPPGGAGAGPGGGAGPGAGPLSLATATVEQLDGLPGVGPVLARHIVEFRTARGGFRSVEELRQVQGIGERRFAELRGLVRL
ncbi:ComEA family DNA-binding protein [Streptomyces sp. NPDC048606]|uniref:ComEA family DNA-binding protein n=1 Tax=Streptomyces sp. NPDC048606 TaxID=3154726 RepID=UPI00343A6DBD